MICPHYKAAISTLFCSAAAKFIVMRVYGNAELGIWILFNYLISTFFSDYSFPTACLIPNMHSSKLSQVYNQEWEKSVRTARQFSETDTQTSTEKVYLISRFR